MGVVGLAPHLAAGLRDPRWELLADPADDPDVVVVAGHALARPGRARGAWATASVLAVLPPGGDPSDAVELFDSGADGCVASDDPREVHAHLTAVVRRLAPTTGHAPPANGTAPGGPDLVYPQEAPMRDARTAHDGDPVHPHHGPFGAMDENRLSRITRSAAGAVAGPSRRA